jgi:hypothetical protein
VTYISYASNLVSGDTNGTSVRVWPFLRAPQDQTWIQNARSEAM